MDSTSGSRSPTGGESIKPARQTSMARSGTISSSHSRTDSSYQCSASSLHLGVVVLEQMSLGPRDGHRPLVAEGPALGDEVARLVQMRPRGRPVTAAGGDDADGQQRLDPAGPPGLAHVQQVVRLVDRLVPAAQVDLRLICPAIEHIR